MKPINLIITTTTIHVALFLFIYQTVVRYFFLNVQHLYDPIIAAFIYLVNVFAFYYCIFNFNRCMQTTPKSRKSNAGFLLMLSCIILYLITTQSVFLDQIRKPLSSCPVSISVWEICSLITCSGAILIVNQKKKQKRLANGF